MAITEGMRPRLRDLTTDRGVVAVVAADHRDSLRQWLDPDDPDGVSAERLSAIKIDLVDAIGDAASGYMLDPEYGLGPVTTARVLPDGVGTIVSLEAQGYFSDPLGGTDLMPDWGVGPAIEEGATAVKLLVLVHPETGEPTSDQVDLITTVVAESRRLDVPLFLEPLAPTARPADRRTVAVTSARLLGGLGPAVAKLPFPVDVTIETDQHIWADACAEMDDACPVPWTLLSGGGTPESFIDQLRVAGAAGCSGFIVGRALWGDAVRLGGEARRAALAADVCDRLTAFREVADAECRPISEASTEG